VVVGGALPVGAIAANEIHLPTGKALSVGLESSAFAAWERHQLERAEPPTNGAAVRGAATFRSMTCVSCHAIGGASEGARFAPDLTHLASRTTLDAGVLPNTPENLARWLHDPQAIKAGCHMPDTPLTDAHVSDLVAYFETLR
jgi:cytochrome c oxidase subunit 2